jgi:hypothetical protein
MGVAPAWFLRPMEPAVNRVIERVTGQQPAQANQAGDPGPGEAVAPPSRP